MLDIYFKTINKGRLYLNLIKKILITFLIFSALISLTITLTGCPTKGSEELLKKAEDLIKLKEEETKKDVEEEIQKTEEETTEEKIEKTREEEKTEELAEVKKPLIKIVSIKGYNAETFTFYESENDTFKANITEVVIGLKMEDIDLKEDTITVSYYLDEMFYNIFPINDVLVYDNGVYSFAIPWPDAYKEGGIFRFIFKVNRQEVETVEFSVEPIEEEIVEEKTEEETTEEKKEVLTAPTIRLEIVEGPTFSQAGDNVCYYRIKAHVTGNPYPAISFNKDDSKGAWGKNIAQVNLYKSGETFTLEANAINSQGTAKDSIKLSYTCQKHIPILVINDTGGILSLSLSGPANYNFNIPPGQQNIYVIPGTYNYTARGCGGAVESGTENLSRSGHEWKWWCE